MESEKRDKYGPQQRYSSKMIRRYVLQANRKTDADIIEQLEGKPIQTEIKRLIRIAVQCEKEK